MDGFQRASHASSRRSCRKLYVMKIAPLHGVGTLEFGSNQADCISTLGAPVRETTSRLGEKEFHYPHAIYRFSQNNNLVEVTLDASLVELENKFIPFPLLANFLEQNDHESFETVGFIVSPKFGIAFDPQCPSWVTAFPKESITKWQDV